MKRWNKERFSVYDSEEKSVLGLIKELGKFVNFVGDELENKTDLKGDHQGTWFGFKPTQVGEYLQTMVDSLNKKVQNFDFIYIEEIGDLQEENDTILLQNAINYAVEKDLVLNLGNKTLLVDSVTIPSNAKIIGGIIKGISETNLINIVEGENILIKDIIFDGLNTSSNAITINTSKSVIIEGCTIKNFKGKGIDVSNSSFITIKENIINDVDGQGINFSFSSNSKIYKNDVGTAMHGIQFWGGDSANESNLGIEKLIISENNVKNVTGGIWGSLGKEIIINNNIVENCSDVGIDFEGCDNSNANGNTVKNCTNSGLAVFYGGKNISFSANNVIQEINAPCVKMFGSTKMIKNIAITGNILNGHQGLYTDENSCENLLISNNQFINENFNISLIKCNKNVISNNIFYNESSKGVIIDGGKNNSIVNNKFYTTFTSSVAASESGGIAINWANTTFDCSNNFISDNEINDYNNSIVVDSWGWDSGAKCIIKNNHLNSIHIKAPGAGFLGVCEGNTKLNNPSQTVGKTDF